ncbi:MAG: DUF2330 domain-containing protein [Myxococcota bacterium]
MQTPRILPLTVLAGAAALVVSITPTPASACGGLFCSTSPVDQNAERILFEVNEDGSVTATVEISYSGDPENFSWIVPVTETPSSVHADTPPSALRLLDLATAPVIIPPPTTCDSGGFLRGGVIDSSAPTAAESADGGVTVEDLPVVGPYDPEVISADDPELLIEWLEENGYTITEEMKPFIAEYVGGGFKFLGVKLTPNSGVTDIRPFSFTCPAAGVLVPLKLTAIASEPEMGVLVFVAGEKRYASQNFRMIDVDTDQVQFDPAIGASNYYPLVSWLIDEEGGTAFVTEYADGAADVRQSVSGQFLNTADFEESLSYMQGVLDKHDYLTRMYTRISGWEMVDDPVFAPFDGADVSNIHDLSNRPAVEVCGGNVEAVPCGQTYCGAGQQCATTSSGADACVCSDGFVARAITAPVGRGRGLAQSVTCQDASLDMLASLEGAADPCAGVSCGEGGQCVGVNGFATCACESGYAARLDFSGNGLGLTCDPVVSIFGPEQLLWPRGWSDLGCSCDASNAKALPTTGLGVSIFGLALLVRRRRKR